MGAATAIVLLLWIPSTAVAVVFLWPGFEQDVVRSKGGEIVRTRWERVIFLSASVTVFFVLCALVGPVAVWRVLTSPPEE